LLAIDIILIKLYNGVWGWVLF